MMAGMSMGREPGGPGRLLAEPAGREAETGEDSPAASRVGWVSGESATAR